VFAEEEGAAAAAADDWVPATVVLVVDPALAVELDEDPEVAASELVVAVVPLAPAMDWVLDGLRAMAAVSPATPTTLTTPVAIRARRAG